MRGKAHLAEYYRCQAGATSIPTKYRNISWINLNCTATLVSARGRALGSWKAWQLEIRRDTEVSLECSSRVVRSICMACCSGDLSVTPRCLPHLSDFYFPRYSFKLNTVVDSKVTKCCNDLTSTTSHCSCV